MGGEEWWKAQAQRSVLVLIKVRPCLDIRVSGSEGCQGRCELSRILRGGRCQVDKDSKTGLCVAESRRPGGIKI